MNNDKLLYAIYLTLYENGIVQTIKGKAKDRDARAKIIGHTYYAATDYPWPVIGITDTLLEEFKKNNFKRPSVKDYPITRSHVFHRKDFMRKLFEIDKFNNPNELRNYFKKNDICILSLRQNNKDIKEKIYDTKNYWKLDGLYQNIFFARNTGWGYDKERLKEFYYCSDKKKANTE
jgi:hypothetical protein